jgi:RNA polymerase sigma-70 factor, ECF subfamily
MLPSPDGSCSAPHEYTRGETEREVVRSDSERLARFLEAVALRRDQIAFAALYRFFAPRLKAFGIRQGAPPAVAEDLAQETMLVVWRRADSFDRCRATPSTWVFTILRNKRIDLERRARSRDVCLDDVTICADGSENPESSIAAALAGHALRKAIGALPRKQMEVLALAYFEGRSHREIADRLSLPLGTVKSRIRLAMARLRCPELAGWVN